MDTSNKEKIECNIQFYQTLNSNKRIIIHQGGSRSGKTYAICQWIIYLLTTEKERLIITVARKTLPALKEVYIEISLRLLNRLEYIILQRSIKLN